ncbi:hypothetical protein CF113_19365 [Aeromonas veronii]|uniref:Uncharacterized protein n=1 Tax=Aeromonas veronii TaxID=654 RepID=A0A3A9IL01_AERVE|nr:hypothetical protein D6R50_14965 [Aeromonas veronii]TNJ12722.1 hypothetical protein CF113_19365 [Aeromonas veronii]
MNAVQYIAQGAVHLGSLRQDGNIIDPIISPPGHRVTPVFQNVNNGLKVETSPDKQLFNSAELIVLQGRLTPWRHSTKMARLHRSAAIQADKMDKGM